METITLTICEQAENHVGMQKIGAPVSQGLSLQDLFLVQSQFEDTELINLGKEKISDAYILVIRNGVQKILGSDDSSDALYAEQSELNWDKKALMRGKVVNKRARHNLCYGPQSQEPDYQQGKGRVIPFEQCPLLTSCIKYFEALLDLSDLVAEGNRYYDSKCYIGFHGDAERKIVIGIRLGREMFLHFQMFLNCEKVGKQTSIKLSHGDIYIMTEAAAGHNWKKRKIHTLRHSASY